MLDTWWIFRAAIGFLIMMHVLNICQLLRDIYTRDKEWERLKKKWNIQMLDKGYTEEDIKSIDNFCETNIKGKNQ